MFELFANIGDPDQTPHSAASDLGLHCLSVTRFGISSLQKLILFRNSSVNLFKGTTFPNSLSANRSNTDRLLSFRLYVSFYKCVVLCFRCLFLTFSVLLAGCAV